MTPPQLTRDAPVLQVLKPIEVDLLPTLRVKRDGTVLDDLERLLLQLVDRDEPLLGKPRLERVVAAVAMHDGVLVVLDVIEQAEGLELGDDRLRASSRDIPENLPKPSTTCAVSSKMLIFSRPARSPMAKSLGSWAGVTFTQPVPNSLST